MKSRNNGSRIFMTELMFSILFFIIISAVCLQCFAGSYARSNQAEEMTQAVNLATNAAEDYLSDNAYSGFTDYYDGDWQETTDNNAKYKVTSLVIEPEQEGQCQSMHVVVTTMADEEIYSLVVEKAVR